MIAKLLILVALAAGLAVGLARAWTNLQRMSDPH